MEEGGEEKSNVKNDSQIFHLYNLDRKDAIYRSREDWNKFGGEKNKEISFRHNELEVPERLPSVIIKQTVLGKNMALGKQILAC